METRPTGCLATCAKNKKAEPGGYSRFRFVDSELWQLSLNFGIVDRTVNNEIFDLA